MRNLDRSTDEELESLPDDDPELVAARELQRFPRPSEAGKALVAEAEISISIREAIVQCDAASAASWSALVAAMEAVPPEHADVDELGLARAELREMQEAYVAALRAATLC